MFRGDESAWPAGPGERSRRESGPREPGAQVIDSQALEFQVSKGSPPSSSGAP